MRFLLGARDRHTSSLVRLGQQCFDFFVSPLTIVLKYCRLLMQLWSQLFHVLMTLMPSRARNRLSRITAGPIRLFSDTEHLVLLVSTYLSRPLRRIPAPRVGRFFFCLAADLVFAHIPARSTSTRHALASYSSFWRADSALALAAAPEYIVAYSIYSESQVIISAGWFYCDNSS